MNRFPLRKYEHGLDAKLRVTIPKDFRESFGEELLLLHDRGDHKMLYIYPEGYIADKIQQLPSPLDPDFNPDKLLRLLALQGTLRELKYDGINRVTIPEIRERKISDIQKVVFQGAGEYIALFLGSLKEMAKYQ